MFLILISAQAEPILCGNNPLLGKLRPFIVECFQLRRECCFFLREARHFSDIREDFLPGHLLVDLIAARFQTGDLSLQFFQPVFFFPGFGLKRFQFSAPASLPDACCMERWEAFPEAIWPPEAEWMVCSFAGANLAVSSSFFSR